MHNRLDSRFLLFNYYASNLEIAFSHAFNYIEIMRGLFQLNCSVMLPACYVHAHTDTKTYHTLTHIIRYRDRTRYAQHTTNLPPLEIYHQLVRVTIKQNNTRDKVHLTQCLQCDITQK